MTRLTKIYTHETKTVRFSVYEGSGNELFLRVEEGSPKADDWQQVCLSAEEAATLRDYITHALEEQ